jgi:hypothetical protein
MMSPDLAFWRLAVPWMLAGGAPSGPGGEMPRSELAATACASLFGGNIKKACCSAPGGPAAFDLIDDQALSVIQNAPMTPAGPPIANRPR